MVVDSGDAQERGAIAHGRPPTMRDIADHVGVSRQLVSLVLRGVAGPSADSRDRILSAARELGYRPNASARLLRQKRTRLIGVVFEMRNPFQVRFVESLLVKAAELQFNIALGPMTGGQSTDVAVAELMEQRVEALIAFNPDPASAELAEARQRVPILWLGEWAPDQDVDNVHVDEALGLRLAVEHLVALGHRDIAYFGGIGGTLGGDRATAYRDAMAASGLSERSEVIESDFFEEGGAAAAREILARSIRPTAVICSSDQCAAGALAVFARAGLAVPAEISVAGFDDSYVAALSYHRLTSVHQDVDATVESALSAVVERLDGYDGPRRALATVTTLTVRESTGPARVAAQAG